MIFLSDQLAQGYVIDTFIARCILAAKRNNGVGDEDYRGHALAFSVFRLTLASSGTYLRLIELTVSHHETKDKNVHR